MSIGQFRSANSGSVMNGWKPDESVKADNETDAINLFCLTSALLLINKAIRENDVNDISSKSERKSARWIKITGMRPPEYAGRQVCSECGGMALENRMREVLSEYCPYCGAKMEG